MPGIAAILWWKELLRGSSFVLPDAVYHLEKAFRDRKFDKFPFQCFTSLTGKALFLITKPQFKCIFLLMSLAELGNSWSPSST